MHITAYATSSMLPEPPISVRSTGMPEDEVRARPGFRLT